MGSGPNSGWGAGSSGSGNDYRGDDGRGADVDMVSHAQMGGMREEASLKTLVFWTFLSVVAVVANSWGQQPPNPSATMSTRGAPAAITAPKFPAQAWVNPNPAPPTVQPQPPTNAVPLVLPKGYVAPPEQNLVQPSAPRMLPPPVAAPMVGQNPPPTATQGPPGTTIAVPMYSRMQPPPHHPPAEEPPKK
jgi:hypothetical protein